MPFSFNCDAIIHLFNRINQLKRTILFFADTKVFQKLYDTQKETHTSGKLPPYTLTRFTSRLLSLELHQIAPMQPNPEKIKIVY